MISARSFSLIAASLATLIAVVAAFILLTPQGADLVVRISSDHFLGHGRLSYERMEGSLIKGLRVFNMEVRRPFIFSNETVVRVQELDMRLARFSIDGIDATVVNTRILDPKADPVVLNGVIHEGRYDANVYSSSLDLAVLRQAIKHFRNLFLPQGELRILDLVVSGTLSRPVLKGTFTVDRVVQKGLVLYEAPVVCDIYFMRSGGLWSTYGKILIRKGSLQGPRVLVHLGESRLIFSGDPVNPELDIKGTAVIARTRIEISVKGTRKTPHVQLTSDPSLPQEQLLLMLTTGKRWDGLSASMATRKMTPELAGDFVDLFFFGGSGQNLAKMFGFDSVSYKLDQTKQGVMVNKDISDRLGVGYGVELAQPQQNEQKSREITQTVEGEYRVTEKVTVRAQKEILPSQPAAAVDKNSHQVSNDKVYLRYKTDF